MRKIFFLALFALPFGIISAKNVIQNNCFDEFLDVATPCTITVTKYCAGAGKDITTSKTSPDGNCDAAYAVANSQWNTDCTRESIKKAIAEADDTTTP